MQKYGIFTDGLHEALFGMVIQFPPYTPIVKVVENDSFLVQAEARGNGAGKFQPDWVRYADLLCYGALKRRAPATTGARTTTSTKPCRCGMGRGYGIGQRSKMVSTASTSWLCSCMQPTNSTRLYPTDRSLKLEYGSFNVKMVGSEPLPWQYDFKQGSKLGKLRV